jgi:hypothetical protein
MHKHRWLIDQLAKIVDYAELEGLGEVEEILIDAIEQIAPLLVPADGNDPSNPLSMLPIITFPRPSNSGQ